MTKKNSQKFIWFDLFAKFHLISFDIFVILQAHFHGCHRSGDDQEKKKKALQGQGNVREFYSGSGKIAILQKSRENCYTDLGKLLH